MSSREAPNCETSDRKENDVEYERQSLTFNLIGKKTKEMTETRDNLLVERQTGEKNREDSFKPFAAPSRCSDALLIELFSHGVSERCASVHFRRKESND